jgi:hypothetical protein
MASIPSAYAQQITGTPGSPSATTTIKVSSASAAKVRR